MNFIVTEITNDINLKDFKCTNEDVNKFLKIHALNNHLKNLSKIYILINEETSALIGYMTLSADALRLPDSKKYEIREVPAILLGRIGIDDKYRGKKYAETYLIPFAIGVCHEVMNNIGCRLLIAEINLVDSILDFFLKNGFKIERESKKYHYLSIDLLI